MKTARIVTMLATPLASGGSTRQSNQTGVFALPGVRSFLSSDPLSDFVVTPLRRIVMTHRDRRFDVGLKLETANPTGSIKDRTAAGLLAELQVSAPLTPGSVVVESTSGNLGLALATLLSRTGCHFIAVIDPKTTDSMRRALHEAGAEVHVVEEPDGHGGYLLTRLAHVRALCARNPEYRWLNQYENLANPRAHARTTGPEIVQQASATLDAVYVPVSTGGTLAGVSRYLRAHRPDVRIVAVDAVGSRAIGESTGRRLLTGIGASRRSSFLFPGVWDRAVHVRDVDAFAMCRVLRSDLGVCLGGSSGSALWALGADLAAGWQPHGLRVCLCPDGGERYVDTFYARPWLTRLGIAAEVDRSVAQLRAVGVSFGEQ
jgi:2,3-diaminopropionate biosynthesis protein SbnA